MSESGLGLDGVRCGQLTCQIEEYCSPETSRCAPCNVVCNKTNHNFDTGLCVKECQGYLLDLRYVRKSEFTGSTDYSSVQRQATAALICAGLALAVLLLVLIIVCKGRFSWRYFKQKFQPSKNRVKQYPAGLTHSNPHAEMAKPKHELKLEIRNTDPPVRTQPLNARDLDTRTSHTEKSQGATTPKTVSTAVSNRYPAEDASLDHYVYENKAMNVTPPEQPAASHRF